MTDLITLHTHSTFCGHAKDPLSAMVDAASRAGVRVMAATEHYPVNECFDPFKHASMSIERLEPYCQAVLDERDRHPEMEILLGCELDWLGKDEDRDLSAEDFDRFDIVLGSVHFVDGWLINSTRTKERWGEVGVDDVWRRYVDLWCDAAASDDAVHGHVASRRGEEIRIPSRLSICCPITSAWPRRLAKGGG